MPPKKNSAKKLAQLEAAEKRLLAKKLALSQAPKKAYISKKKIAQLEAANRHYEALARNEPKPVIVKIPNRMKLTQDIRAERIGEARLEREEDFLY